MDGTFYLDLAYTLIIVVVGLIGGIYMERDCAKDKVCPKCGCKVHRRENLK